MVECYVMLIYICPYICPRFSIVKIFFNNFFLFKKDFNKKYKIVQNYLKSITEFQFFPFWDSWGKRK